MTSSATPLPRWRAATRRLDAPDDLLDARGPDGFAWLHNGAGFVTAGVAACVDVDRVDEVLASFDVDDPLGWPGTGPVAVGALPFDREAPGQLVIPSTIVGKTPDGDGWVTEIGPAGARLRVSAPVEHPPTRFTVTAGTDAGSWRVLVLEALESIEGGELDKVVLARDVVVEADAPFVVSTVLEALRAEQPECYVHHADGLVGASPELLVRRIGNAVESRPMAGTARATPGACDRLSASAKDAYEHRVVVDAVLDALGPICSSLDASTRPDAMTFGSVVHLATPVHGVLDEPAPSALVIARRLHPTPAVAGTPTEQALAAIARLEPRPRGRYAGPVGWVDRRGDGEWAIALRGAELVGARAVLRVGAGIVVGSDPDAEWAETEAKLEPMLRALVG